MSVQTRTYKVAIVALLLVVGGSWVGELSAEPKNVIFMIGDGMGFEQVKAGRFYSGEPLSFEGLPYTGEMTTHSADNAVTDSAAGGTALATGVKVNNGVISLALPGDGSELETLLEYYQAVDRSAGLVTTTYMAHATPATFAAHENSRDKYNQIADDYLTQTRPNVLFGGNSYMSGAAAAGYTVVTDYDSMDALDTETETVVSGQFGSGYMPYELDGLGSLPHLSHMTATALAILDNDADGFFLMVEGGRIDHACHDNDLERMVHEVIEFSNAVEMVLDWVAANDPGFADTLILVTADHETGGLTVTDNGPNNYPDATWTTTGHSAANVPIYAIGVNAELIGGVMDNTDMFGVVTYAPDTKASSPDPADAATGVALDADLSWSGPPIADTYDVYFGDTDPPAFVGNQAGTTYDPGTLAGSVTYYWRIDVVEADGVTVHTGDLWSFTCVEAPPDPAEQVSPVNGATGLDVLTTILVWDSAAGATSYEIYLSIDPGNLGDPVSVTGTTYEPGPLLASTIYYWQVDSVNAGGTTPGSVWQFTTADPPGAASAPQPPDGAQALPVETDLSWTAGADATAHDVYLGVDPGALDLVSAGQPSTTYDPGTLNGGVLYYWRIDELGAGGATPGPVWTFTTAALPWFDGFESGDVTTGGWVEDGLVDVTADGYAGTYAARINKSGFIEKAISTAGFASISVSFACRTEALDSGEFMALAWWSPDGVNWEVLDTTPSSVSQWTEKTIPCPAGAGDNPNFRVRFSSNADKNKEYVFIDDVQISATASGPDETPPTPDPMTWAIVPHATGAGSISMTATTATDPSGVEYYFTCTVGGGHDSGWQASPTYEDTGLDPEATYTYTVAARDKSAAQNTTGVSTAESATTLPVTDTALYVQSVVLNCKEAGRNYFVSAEVTIYDGTGVPVEGATVTGEWSGAYTGTSSGTTAGDGSTTLSEKVSGPGTYYFTVTDVVLTGYVYTPSLNNTSQIQTEMTIP